VVAWADKVTKLNIEFCDEVKEFLNMKKKSTAKVYKAGLRLFISFYKDRYGQNLTFSNFLDTLEENSRLPRNKRRKLAETELVEFIKHLEKLNYSRNSIRAYIAGVQNFLKYKDFTRAHGITATVMDYCEVKKRVWG
jgi:hypothetical protein